MTWIGRSLFDLLLRLHPFGRLALSRERIVASNWLGACLLAALAALACYFAGYESALFGALVFGLLTIPVSAVFNCQRGRPRMLMATYTVALAAVGLVAAVPAQLLELLPPALGTFLSASVVRPSITVFLIGAIATPWVGNVLVSQRPKF